MTAKSYTKTYKSLIWHSTNNVLSLDFKNYHKPDTHQQHKKLYKSMKISQFVVCEKFWMSNTPDVPPQNKCFAKVGIYNPGQNIYFCIIFATIVYIWCTKQHTHTAKRPEYHGNYFFINLQKCHTMCTKVTWQKSVRVAQHLNR